MKSKWTLFGGILFVIMGIVLRRITELGFGPILLIVLGALLKTYYIFNKVKRGSYKPGYELIFLFGGLILFLSGIYMRSHQPAFSPKILIFLGIFLKITFIVMFVIKVKTHENKSSTIQ